MTNGSTVVVMLLISGHARSAPSASVKSGTSKTTMLQQKGMIWCGEKYHIWHLIVISLTDCST